METDKDEIIKMLKVVEEWQRRYIHAHTDREMLELARDILHSCGWEFRKNAGIQDVLSMLICQVVTDRRSRLVDLLPVMQNRRDHNALVE